MCVSVLIKGIDALKEHFDGVPLVSVCSGLQLAWESLGSEIVALLCRAHWVSSLRLCQSCNHYTKYAIS